MAKGIYASRGGLALLDGTETKEPDLTEEFGCLMHEYLQVA
jgi:hypothetical protein